LLNPDDPRFAGPWQGRVRRPPNFISAVRLQQISGNRGTQQLLAIGDGAAPPHEPAPASLAVKLAGRWKRLLGLGKAGASAT